MKYKVVLLLSVVSTFLPGCDNSQSTENKQQAQELVKHSLNNMVLVKGGEFLMGDFGPLVGEKLPFSIQQDDKVLHRVILSDFSISKYKVTNVDYNDYLSVTGIRKLPLYILAKNSRSLQKINYSVYVNWQQAKDYCLWLGKMSGKKIDLPTEAQWEYAARSRGEYFPYATNNGKLEKGMNIPTYEEKEQMTGGLGLPYYPIGKYPPNPLGLYDMGLSGKEWIYDWYAADYYTYSPQKNPTGPQSGKKKVLRGYAGGDYQSALTMFRQSSLPFPVLDGSKYEEDGITPSYVFRCVVNN
ncbi:MULTISPECIES: SUMF1/EgtB/PvdO family nonheme iron enzyme [Rahnella]|uniref:SUMF1/EgtB/PvdO family nonheme iron enzyme n=1 Tax=Rahnella laticis TaxID=2787622 RepID=A0ABS0E1J5_9GAMM|nr:MULTISPECIES: SUMF1/EgtB/PvdO family nonheme iron enzyme [Rahnella]MBF7978982.1 SUMF1/EgtB/PvdO family nonheme iron enzyme [Rahnella laticis]MBF7999072.1 SUMF1/EgtB/PvdO family nonheme iron enzyme [Rahnella sp. LAC-M12]